jgi:two-component system, LuxR family, response regulator DctR
MTERSVYIVDDDEAVRDSLAMLFRTAGLRVETFDSGLAFLRHYKPRTQACLVLDIRMPGLNGTALHDELIERGVRLPVIFITGHGDIPMAVAAMKKGAYDFVEKPYDGHRLLCQVLDAIEDTIASPKRPVAAPRELLAQLSAREREVLDRVLEGKSSRQVGEELYISVKTVDFHRARIMQKLGVRSVAELFRACFAR